MVHRGRLDAVKPFWEKYHVDFGVEVLGWAASSGQEDILQWLLEDARLDPTKPVLRSANPSNGEETPNDDTTQTGRRAYDLASNKEIRNIFRRIAHAHPDWWDWKEAHVPSGLSEEMETAQDQKRVERRKGLRDKLKDRDKARADAEAAEAAEQAERDRVRAEMETKARALLGVSAGPQKLGGRVGAEGMGGMTVDMRAKIERERRARAAEARLR